jgi:hypothetical protein
MALDKLRVQSLLETHGLSPADPNSVWTMEVLGCPVSTGSLDLNDTATELNINRALLPKKNDTYHITYNSP